jgi:hypothetical protein
MQQIALTEVARAVGLTKSAISLALRHDPRIPASHLCWSVIRKMVFGRVRFFIRSSSNLHFLENLSLTSPHHETIVTIMRQYLVSRFRP